MPASPVSQTTGQDTRWSCVGALDRDRADDDLRPVTGQRPEVGKMLDDQDAIGEQDLVDRPVESLFRASQDPKIWRCDICPDYDHAVVDKPGCGLDRQPRMVVVGRRLK